MLCDRVILASKTCKSEAFRLFRVGVSTLGIASLLTACTSDPPNNAGYQPPQSVAVSQPSSNRSTSQPATGSNEARSANSKTVSVAEGSPASSPDAASPVTASGTFAAVHIKAGDGDSFTDSAGNVWQTDRGFD